MNTQDKNTLYRLLAGKDLIACGYEKLSLSAGAEALTIPTGATYAELRLESDVTTQVAARYLMLGAADLPTTSRGLALNNLDFFDINNGTNLVNFRIIQATAGTHVLHIQYYK